MAIGDRWLLKIGWFTVLNEHLGSQNFGFRMQATAEWG